MISNGTYTKYYSNTTRFSHIKEQNQTKSNKGKRTSNSFEFTSWWADASNKPITDLMDSGGTFFAKHTLLKVILCKYCVFTSDQLLLAMRPYQIVATERILNRINVANNYSLTARWMPVGIYGIQRERKTLTSFKTAQLAAKLSFVSKVLFVVDRKDLDYQTMKEYDKFEKGAANSNTNISVLKSNSVTPRPISSLRRYKSFPS